MVTCNDCQTRNSLDSAFCKHCGKAMDADLVKAERTKIEELVSEGFRLFNENRAEEAKLIAEKALEDIPDFPNALSLKGMCYEREGELHHALLCYEKIVEINPDSSLDRIKVTQLRNAIDAKLIEAPTPSKGRALIGAIAATFLVISIGVATAGFMSAKPDESAKENNGAGLTAFNQNSGLPLQSNQGAANPVQTEQKPPENQAPTTTNQPSQSQGGTNRGANDFSNIPPNGDVREMPGSGSTLEIRPVDPTGGRGTIPNNPGTGDATGNSQQPNNRTTDPNEPTVGDQKTPPVVQPPAEKDPGIIEIKVNKGQPNRGGSVPVSDNPNQAAALVQTARQQFVLGQFDRAARNYEAALRAGADAGSTNQRLGQCYAQLNRVPDAIQSYERAISAYQSQLSSGRGDKERLENAIDVCKQALKVLRGS